MYKTNVLFRFMRKSFEKYSTLHKKRKKLSSTYIDMQPKSQDCKIKYTPNILQKDSLVNLSAHLSDSLTIQSSDKHRNHNDTIFLSKSVMENDFFQNNSFNLYNTIVLSQDKVTKQSYETRLRSKITKQGYKTRLRNNKLKQGYENEIKTPTKKYKHDNPNISHNTTSNRLIKHCFVPKMHIIHAYNYDKLIGPYMGCYGFVLQSKLKVNKNKNDVQKVDPRED